MNWNKIEEQFFKILTGVCTVGIMLVLVTILGVVIYRGLPAISWEMLTKTPEGGFYLGESGGIFNAIMGSIWLALGATLMAFLLSLPLALFMNIHMKRHPKRLTLLRLLLDVLWGIPSIVYGAFGFTLMMFLGLKASLLAGIITVGLLIMPVMTRAFDEVLRNIPTGLLEAAYSLGSTRAEVAFKVFCRQALPGFITAILLAFGRGIGDAASVLFTAGYTDNLPENLSDPTATLPLAIFFQLSSPVPQVQERAFAAAFVLTFIVLVVSVGGRLLIGGFKKFTL